MPVTRHWRPNHYSTDKMTLNEIPKSLGFRSMRAFSVELGDSPQAFQFYASGRRGRFSKYLQKVADFAGLKFETVFFKTDAPKDSAQYWHDLAIECERMAERAKED